MYALAKSLLNVLLRACCVFALLSPATHAFAQRGNLTPFPNEDVPPQTATDGFPGFFDTTMAAPGSFVFDFPTFNFDYGVNEKLTIGANSLGALLMLTTFSPALVVKARYRLFSTGDMRDTLTVYGGYAHLKATKETPSVTFQAMVMTNNFTYYFSPRSQIYASTLVGRLDYTESKESSIDYNKLSLNPILLSFGYQHFFTERLGLSPLLIYNFYSNLEQDSAQAAVSASRSMSAASSNLIIRIALDVKFGDSFLLSAYQISTFGEDGLATAPWASFMYRW